LACRRWAAKRPRTRQLGASKRTRSQDLPPLRGRSSASQLPRPLARIKSRNRAPGLPDTPRFGLRGQASLQQASNQRATADMSTLPRPASLSGWIDFTKPVGARLQSLVGARLAREAVATVSPDTPRSGLRGQASRSPNKKYAVHLQSTAALLLPRGRGSWLADDGLRSGPEPDNSVRQNELVLRIYHRCAADRRQANSHGLWPESKAETALPVCLTLRVLDFAGKPRSNRHQTSALPADMSYAAQTGRLVGVD